MADDLPDVTFLDIYECSGAYELLWQLLQEREPEVNISHRAMPSWDEHVAFIDGKPYKSWHFIVTNEDTVVGAIYLSKQNEIGIHVFRKHHGKRYGRAAVLELLAWHPGERLFANIAPFNQSSLKMFNDLGFHLVEHTFERYPSDPRFQTDLLHVSPGDHQRIEQLQVGGYRLLQHTFAVDTPLVKMGMSYASS
jgi:RimJ/RimL family protein N-acetyltransferase